MRDTRTRIFIDCSHINFSKQPTGIPRVVLNYIDAGYSWGAQRGTEVIPVVPTDDGLVICRPLPGRSPPKALLELVEASDEAHQVPAGLQLVSNFLLYLIGIVTALANLAASVLPTASARTLATRLDHWLRQQTGALLQRRARRADDLIRVRPGKGDIIFAPAYWHDVDPRLYRRLKDGGAKIVILVHDILPIVFEKFYPSPWRHQFRDRVLQTTTYADALFCVSDYTRETLVEFLIRHKRVVPPIATAHNGFEPLVSAEGLRLIRGRETLPHLSSSNATRVIRERQPYLMVGSVEPKKGHVPTIACFESMWRAGLDRDLVIIGRKGWMEREITEMIEKSIYFGQKLHWFSNLDDFDLADAYIHCHALVFSSVAEGFGIPMVEAAYYGKPAIVFDTPIAREVIGDVGLPFVDAATLVERVMQLENAGTYEDACVKASAYHWPSWDECTPAIFDRLVDLAGGQSPAVKGMPRPLTLPVAHA